MLKKEDIEARAEAMVMPLVDENHFELVDVEYVKEGGTRYLRFYIDKPGGITVDDCEIVSRALSDMLDADDFIEESYVLEVSSPGLGRPLKKEKDFKRSLGDRVELRLFQAVEHRKEWEGILSAYDDTTVTLTLDDDTEKTFERKSLALIRLAFDF